jgi:hypothetical protein
MMSNTGHSSGSTVHRNDTWVKVMLATNSVTWGLLNLFLIRLLMLLLLLLQLTNCDACMISDMYVVHV